MSEALCRSCGSQVVLRSRFDSECTECGSEELDFLDAYEPDIEHELRCEWCGFEIDTTIRDGDWPEDIHLPTSVDDPCPICAVDRALVPKSEATSVRDIPEYKLVRAAARKLRESHLSSPPPYDMRHLASRLGLDVMVADDAVDGLLIGKTIKIPPNQSTGVERFLIAHEIGHHHLQHEGERQKIEPEANAFASELIIPQAELKAAVATEPSIRALQRRFGTSRSALIYALMSARQISRVTP